MNAIEERLRDAYRAAAQTIPPEAVSGLARSPRSQPRARRYLVLQPQAEMGNVADLDRGSATEPPDVPHDLRH
jgi:hypothetical protein